MPTAPVSLAALIAALAVTLTSVAAKPLTPDVRQVLVKGTSESCFSNQVKAPANKDFTLGQLQTYCDCYANGFADNMQEEDMEKNQNGLTPEASKLADHDLTEMRGGTEKMSMGLSRRFCNITSGAFWLAATGAMPVHAQGLPTPLLQEVLVKTNLLSFNDAVTQDNFTVFHLRLSKPFRDQFPPDRLRQTFKDFVEKRAAFDVIAAKPVVPAGEAKIDSDGVLRLNGYFETTPKQVKYQLGFIRSEGEWKLSSINVQIEAP